MRENIFEKAIAYFKLMFSVIKINKKAARNYMFLLTWVSDMSHTDCKTVMESRIILKRFLLVY